MSITRDQLRAARVLLHLHQKHLADLSRVSLSTIRRFEGGLDIGHLHMDAIRRALVEAGAVFVDPTVDGDAAVPRGATGVVLRPDAELPEATRIRIASEPAGGDAGLAAGTR